MPKGVRYQTTLNIKVEVAFVTTVDEAITITPTSIARKRRNVRWLWKESEGVPMKRVWLFSGQFNTRFVKKESALSTSIKRGLDRPQTPVTFFLFLKLLINKVHVMLMTKMFDFHGYFNVVITHLGFLDNIC
jgi:hypothetical protein